MNCWGDRTDDFIKYELHFTPFLFNGRIIVKKK